MTNTELNHLPVPTWNQCGVNSAPKSAALPAIPAGGWRNAAMTVSALPDGVQETDTGFETFAESGVGRVADEFILQNAGENRHLVVPEGMAPEAPVICEIMLDADHPHAVTCLSVDAGENSALTVVEIVRGDAEDGVCASLTRIRAARDAHVKLVQIQLLGEQSRCWNAVAIEEGREARVEQVRVELGGRVVVCGAQSQLRANHSEYDLDAAYFGQGSAVLDFNDVSVHTGRDTLCEMHTAGVLAGRADKILRGTVDFRRGAKRGVGHESEDVLLFSPHVRNRTAPLILCGEEEVEGQHAASIGRLDEEKLYYLRSRGLDEAQARRLMVDARFAPVLDKIPLDTVREEVSAEVARRLDHAANESVGE